MLSYSSGVIVIPLSTMSNVTAQMAMRTNVLYMYKNLLKSARALSEPKRSQSLRTIKEDFKKGALEMDESRVSAMLVKANSTLGERDDPSHLISHRLTYLELFS